MFGAMKPVSLLFDQPTYMGPLSFTGGVAFPLHHGGVFALKGSAPSRVYYLAGT